MFVFIMCFFTFDRNPFLCYKESAHPTTQINEKEKEKIKNEKEKNERRKMQNKNLEIM